MIADDFIQEAVLELCTMQQRVQEVEQELRTMKQREHQLELEITSLRSRKDELSYQIGNRTRMVAKWREENAKGQVPPSPLEGHTS